MKILFKIICLSLIPFFCFAQSFSKKIKFNGIYLKEGGNPSYYYYDAIRIYPDSTIIIGQFDRDKLINIGPTFNKNNYSVIQIKIADNVMTYKFAPLDSINKQLNKRFIAAVDISMESSLKGKKHFEYKGLFKKRKLQLGGRLIKEDGLFGGILAIKEYRFLKIANLNKNEIVQDTAEVFAVVNEPPQFIGGEEAELAYFNSSDFNFKIKKGSLYSGKYILWSYIIEKDGSISTIRLNKGYSKKVYEGLKSVMDGKILYYPARQNGFPVRFTVSKVLKFTPN